ncbi:MAG: hypothetical protein ACREFI_09890 [Stellaceae bacterium]
MKSSIALDHGMPGLAGASTAEARHRGLLGFASDLVHAPWFTACGMPHTPEERSSAEAYLNGLALPAMPVEGVAGWADAAAIAQRADWSQDWWRREEASARALHQSASRLLGETQMLVSLSAVMLTAAGLHGNASRALSDAGLDDPTLARVAAGAAALACHHMGLVIAAQGGDDHPLARKYRVFAGGRWLLGVMGDHCYLF